MTKIASLCVLLLIAGCASNSKDSNSIENEEVLFVEKVENSCIMTASLFASGMSLLPPVASMFAKEILIKKAKEYRSNRLVLTKNEGLFQVDLEAKAYRCAENKELLKKSAKK